jgi:hypothetical protein
MMEEGGISNLIEWLLYPEESEEEVTDETPTEALSEEQLEELEMLDPSLQPLLVPLLKQTVLPWPEFGYEATSSSGQCGTSILEVAWPDQKVGIALPRDEATAFEAEGWTIFSSKQVTAETLSQAIS